MTEINRRTENYQPPRNATKKDTAEPKVRQPDQGTPGNYNILDKYSEDMRRSFNIIDKHSEELRRMDYVDQERVKKLKANLLNIEAQIRRRNFADQAAKDTMNFYNKGRIK
ncbi:hypothetical protein [Candidatus Regiella endosymbiont of Tuberolachnus salignus]|uniref:hypothetical protein n=1 Tax=Candidatus Regiella endosymbiont of Tuberolachnus salignus TaxID=3077956 RepID=UPI0030D2544B